MKTIATILILLATAAPAEAGLFGGGFNPFFRPSNPRAYHPPMVHRGDWVPYDIAYPNKHPHPQRHNPRPPSRYVR